jgi:hypothetical protein
MFGRMKIRISSFLTSLRAFCGKRYGFAGGLRQTIFRVKNLPATVPQPDEPFFYRLASGMYCCVYLPDRQKKLMKQILPFFFFVVLCSCEQTSKPATSPGTIPTDKAEQQTESARPQQEKHADPSQNALSRRKENKIRKESFLQEMYVRNVATVLRDSLFMSIPFNVHGPDCGAPDCYSTDVRFGFPFADTLLFPKIVRFHEHEHGCVDREKKLSGYFQLVGQNTKQVIYYSGKPKRTLVLFSSKHENGAAAWYFTGLEKDRINEQNVSAIMKEYDEEDKNAIYPFTSWLLTTNEY